MTGYTPTPEEAALVDQRVWWIDADTQRSRSGYVVEIEAGPVAVVRTSPTAVTRVRLSDLRGPAAGSTPTHPQ